MRRRQGLEMERSVAELLKGARVLVVEDEYYLADDLIRSLAAVGAEPVGPFPSLHGAEEKLAEGNIDAAILDMNLRGSLAFDFAARVCSKIPCVIVSGYSGEAIPASVAHIGRLEKPAAPEDVVAMLGEKMAGRVGAS